MKTIKITEETHNKIMLIKAAFNLRTIDLTIQMLVEDHEFTNEVLRLTKNGNK